MIFGGDFKKASEETGVSRLISSSLSPSAFSPANALVNCGPIQFNEISHLLEGDTSKADLLVIPKSTGRIFERELGNFDVDTESIRLIDSTFCFHFNGQAIEGMQIYDRPDDAPELTYEMMLVEELLNAKRRANMSGKPCITGLALGTKQVLSTVFSRVNDINDMLIAQGAQKILAREGSSNDLWHLTCSEFEGYDAAIYCVDFIIGGADWVKKDGNSTSSRAFAYQV